MRFVWILAACGGCATTSASCPSGTKALTVPVGTGRADLCATTEPTAQSLPSSGRSFDLSNPHPPAFTGGVDGPFTSYYEDGALESHGRYVDLGGRSVPQGLWVFWRPNGQRWVYGIYHQGTPVGCFAQFDENGQLYTGVIQGDQLRVQPCSPPPDDSIAVLEGRVREAPPSPAWADIALDALVGPNHLGVSNGQQVEPDPPTSLAFTLSTRYRYGRLRFGPLVGYRHSDDRPDSAAAGGGTFGIELPSFHPRVHPEIAADLGIEHLTLDPGRPGFAGTNPLDFWSAFAALRAGAALELSPTVEAFVAFRVNVLPSYTTHRTMQYCGLVQDVPPIVDCTPPASEAWDIGEINYGVDLGLRFLIR